MIIYSFNFFPKYIYATIKSFGKNPYLHRIKWSSLELKKDYLDTSLGDSIDLVVIGANYGKGKRAGIYGSFLLACYNDDLEQYESVSMTGGGLKDQELSDLYNQLQPLIIPSLPANYKIGKIEPNVLFSPKIVLEIKTADLSLSPIYTAGAGSEDRGISLRFPRFQRVRNDKKPEEACTSEEIVKLYKSQVIIKKNESNNAEYDLDNIY